MYAETLTIIGTVLAVGVGLAGWLMHLAGRITPVRGPSIRHKASGSSATRERSTVSTTRHPRPAFDSAGTRMNRP